MISNILLQSQKNEILILIEEAGLTPFFFEWVNVESQNFSDSTISQLNYRNTDFFYTFDMSVETHYAIFSPAKNSYIGTAYPGLWIKQKKYFTDWLMNLVKENNEPDLWKEISSDKSAPYNKQTYLASPTYDSPDHKTMSGKIDKLLENNGSSKELKKNNSVFVIKRYYGKA